jgi:hypothetical protein
MRISTTKTINKMHICIHHISKSMHFCCCHCTCYQYYCPSLINALQLFVLPWTLSAKPSQTITIIQSNINVKTSLGNGAESEKNIIYILCSKWSPQQPP